MKHRSTAKKPILLTHQTPVLLQKSSVSIPKDVVFEGLIDHREVENGSQNRNNRTCDDQVIPTLQFKVILTYLNPFIL